MNISQTFIAFLRGINVGGHHKVPMAELRIEIERLGLNDVRTFLNSGNVLFTIEGQGESYLENVIEVRLAEVFGFNIPVIVVSASSIISLKESDPFNSISLTKDIRFNVSFLKKNSKAEISLPYQSEDNSFQILSRIDKAICSVLDLSKTGTIQAMKILERTYGKNITSRNWNTIEKICTFIID